MKVSIIVPTYRRDVALENALNSLATQIFKDFEIILVDDNDTPEWNDKVRNVIAEFSKANPEISIKHIENHPNLGSAKARNAGIDAAKGEYVTFLDSHSSEDLHKNAFKTTDGFDKWFTKYVILK